MYRINRNNKISSSFIWVSIAVLVSTSFWIGLYMIIKQTIILLSKIIGG
jgi:hypothetical protein